MIRAHRLALRPSHAARRALDRCAWARRLAFNTALAWHRAERAASRPVPGEYLTATWLRAWRRAAAVEHPDLALVPTRVFEYVAEDLECAWKAAQRLGAGHPHFDRYDSQVAGFAIDGAIHLDATHIKLPRLAPVRVMPHRRPGSRRGPVPSGSYTRARVVKEHGEWFAVLITKAPDVALVAGPPTIGLDWGVRKLATLSDGTLFANPTALQQVAVVAEKVRQSVARKQHASDKRHGGPRKRGERRLVSHRLRLAHRRLAGHLRRAANIRANAIHHATKAIAARGEHVAVEKLAPRNMTARRTGRGRAAKATLNCRILDAAPGAFLRTLAYKLAATGHQLVLVNPAYTSQTCSVCNERTNCGSSEVFTCAACATVIDRDINAAKNILARALLAPDVPAGWTARKRAGSAGKSRRRAQAPTSHGAMSREREGVHDASG